MSTPIECTTAGAKGARSDRPLADAIRYSLEGVGRSLSVSHARLDPSAGKWALDDLGSKNGIFVNGARVARAVIEEEDILDLGHTWPFCEAAPAEPE